MYLSFNIIIRLEWSYGNFCLEKHQGGEGAKSSLLFEAQSLSLSYPASLGATWVNVTEW